MTRNQRPRRRRDEDREAGASIVEFVFWAPVLFAVLAAGIQWGLYEWAYQVAQSAAQAGSATAQQEYASDAAHWYDDSQQAALGQVDALAPNLLEDPTATASQSGTTVTMTVHADVPHILWSWFTPDLTVSSTGSIEQWTAP